VLPNTAKKHLPGERKLRLDIGESKSFTSPVNEVVSNTSVVPQKRSYASALKKPLEEDKQTLDNSFDEVAAFEAEIDADMDEIEEFLEAEDNNLVRIDGLYVQVLEQENVVMRSEIAELRAALINMSRLLQVEAAKVRAFSSVDL